MVLDATANWITNWSSRHAQLPTLALIVVVCVFVLVTGPPLL